MCGFSGTERQKRRGEATRGLYLLGCGGRLFALQRARLIVGHLLALAVDALEERLLRLLNGGLGTRAAALRRRALPSGRRCALATLAAACTRQANLMYFADMDYSSTVSKV